MKILALGNYDHPSESMAFQEVELLRGLKSAGHEVEVVCEESTIQDERFESAGIRTIRMFPRGKYDRGFIRDLRKVLERGEYDIAHAFYSHMISNLNFAARSLPVKVVAYRGAAGIHWHDPTFQLTLYHRRVDGIACISKAVERDVLDQALFRKPKTAVIYKGVDPAWYRGIEPLDRTEIGVPEDAFMAVCIANVRPVKGVEYFVESIRSIPAELPIHLVTAGRDTDSAAMLKRIEDSGRKVNIHPLGFRKDVNRLVATADCLVLPTVSTEGLGRTLMDAMALAIPCIATASGGPEELIEHGESGLIVPRRDSTAIGNSVAVLYRDRELRQKLAKGGQERIFSEFSMQRYVSDTIAFYRSLLGRLEKRAEPGQSTICSISASAIAFR